MALLMLYLAPSIGSLLQLGLSRTREYDADLEGAYLAGNPRGLVSALRKLERYQGRFWEDLAFPVPGRRIPQPSLLRSHPTTEERVERLLALEGRPTLPPIEVAPEPLAALSRRCCDAAPHPLAGRVVLTSTGRAGCRGSRRRTAG